MGWVLDLDGVIWLADDPIPGAAGAVERLRAAGESLVFITNNSNAPVAAVEHKLAAHGIPAVGDVVTSGVAASRLLRPGERVLVCGGPGVREAIERAGAIPVDDSDVDAGVDAVLVGYHREFDYERMRIASAAARSGARLLATNDDATYPTPTGPVPGCGAILASIERAAGVAATVAGKPYPPMADAVRERLGREGIVVGDRADTDGRFARAVGFRFGLVLSGVTRAADLPVAPAPDVVAPDLEALVAAELG